MSRRFIAGILVASIVIAGGAAAPARAADAQKVAKVLGTAAVIYMLGRAVSEARAEARDEDKREKKARVERERRAAEQREAERQARERRERELAWAQRGGGHGRRADGPAAPYLPRPYTPHPRRQALPERCQQDLRDGRSGAVLMAPCLRRSGIALTELPRRCELDVAVGRDVRRAYSERCLLREGYRIAQAPRR